MADNDVLGRVAGALSRGNCGEAIEEMKVYLSAWPEPQTAEKLSQISSDYDMMAGYWRQGFRDPQLEKLYSQMLQRLYVLYANVRHHQRMKVSPYQYSLFTRVRKGSRDWTLASIRQEMEGFVSDVALLELTPDHKRQEKSAEIYRRHQQQMNQLFEYVVTSRQWTDRVGAEFEEMMVSPTIDTVDQQLVVASITLSLINQFDMAKFRVLVNVYRRSPDEAVRQRALVGWVLALKQDHSMIYPEQQQLVDGLLQSEDVCRELTELQLQLVYCMNAEKDNDTIRQEIMPELLKNNTFHITLNGIEEKEDDPLEEVLHPDAVEKKMAKLEESYQRMMDMQRQGSDIFFAGFSQMKRAPFFYDMSNWLVPFYAQHPDIAQSQNVTKNSRLIEGLAIGASLCNSDKYSFVIAFMQMADRIPQSIRQMIERGEARISEMDAEPPTAAGIRRSYLMDIYRFFRLFPHRSEWNNPFDTRQHELGDCLFFALPQLVGSPLDRHKREVVPLLRKQQLKASAREVLLSIPESLHDVQYLMWMEDYEAVVSQQPNNERALASLARVRFADNRYEEALELYRHLVELHPEKRAYRLYEAVCLVNMEQYADALKLLYQLNYEYEDDLRVVRVLAWTLTCDGKQEQATRLFEQLTGVEQPAREDYLNYGYCLWLQGRIDAAADCFRKYAGQQPLSLDEAWLKKRGIGDAETKMMQALVAVA